MKAPTYKTCDLCRKRKTRCIPSSEERQTQEPDQTAGEDGNGRQEGADSTQGQSQLAQRCRTCSRAGTTCTFLRGYQKPGRPRASTIRSSMSPGHDFARRDSHSGGNGDRGMGTGAAVLGTNDGSAGGAGVVGMGVAGPGPSSMATTARRQSAHGNSTRLSPEVVMSYPSYDRGIQQPPVDFGSEPNLAHSSNNADSNTASVPATSTFDIFDTFLHPSPTDPFNPPIISPFHTSNSNPSPNDFIPSAPGITPSLPASQTSIPHPPSQVPPPQPTTGTGPLSEHRLAELTRLNNIPITPTMPLEDVGPWSAMSDILSVYLRYLHSLFPLVHRPSFSQRLAMRADQSDRGFAALLLGLVAYTIGQSPLGRLGSYTRQELHWLQRRCHSASISMLDRRYRRVTVNQISTLMTGYFYCQSTGETNRAIALLAEACQLTHVLCLRSDDEPDCIERELRRRAFWHVYAVDSTEASAGQPIHLNAFEGFPPLPLDVDDEYLTPLGSFAPSALTSSSTASDDTPGTTTILTAKSGLSGFLGCVSLFPILGQTIARHRSLRHRLSSGDIPTAAEIDIERAWVGRVRGELQRKIEYTPRFLKDPDWVGGTDEVSANRGMQRANVLVTIASIQFALLALAEDLETNPEVAAEERANIGRNTFEVLSSLPLDDLAANGESMRGKIFRIMLEMLRGDNPEEWVNQLHDWCNLYSRVQYVQLAVNDLESLFPSRQQSPDL